MIKKACADPSNNPEDWFISKDGLQYPDDPLVLDPNEAIAAAPGRPAADVLEEAEEAALKDALRLRRHAKDKCYTECYVRLECLTIALEDKTPATHGTWGGYYEEELRTLRNEIDRRKRPRTGPN